MSDAVEGVAGQGMVCVGGVGGGAGDRTGAARKGEKEVQDRLSLGRPKQQGASGPCG